MLSNSKDITKCQILQDNDDDAKTIVIPRVFSKNSQAKKHHGRGKKMLVTSQVFIGRCTGYQKQRKQFSDTKMKYS